MQATQLTTIGRFDVVEVAPPSPAPGEVVVEAVATSICGSDLNAFLGTHPRIRPPVVLGHEFAGVIREVGPGVSDALVGARVAVEPTIGCRTCRYCRVGAENVCPDYQFLGENEAHPGSLAGFVRVRADHVHALPATVSFNEGALVQPLAIGLHAVRDRGQVGAGENVLVVGAGAIGLGAAVAAHLAGARVIVSDLQEHRCELARHLGADETVVGPAETVVAAVLEATDGQGVDVAFEAVGGRTPDPLQLAVRSTARRGRVVVIGSFTEPLAPIPIGLVKYQELDVRGSQGHPSTFPEVISRIAGGTVRAAELISHHVPLADVPAAFELLARPEARALKVVIDHDGR